MSIDNPAIIKNSKILLEELESESDRALVILVAAMLEEGLRILLKTYLVAVPTREDTLFDGPNATMSSLSSKIDFAYRLGLMSGKWCRDLHLIRKIRNAFAHNITGCTFEDESVASRVFELKKSFVEIQKDSTIRNNYPPGTKWDFLLCAAFSIFYLHDFTDETVPLKESDLEFYYKPAKRDKKPVGKQKQ